MAVSQRRSTGKELVQQLMRSMSMTVPTTVSGSTDKRSTQFWQLATDAGQQLAMMDYKWQVLGANYNLVGDGATSDWPLPLDFDGWPADATWNTTTRLPAIGALTEQEWRMMVARLVSGGTFTNMFRIENDTIYFLEPIPAGQTVAIPYISRGWVEAATTPTPGALKDNLEEDDDIVRYDPQLFKAKLKLLWYEAKQFDTSKVKKQYEDALAAAKANDVPGRTLTLAMPSAYPLLGALNVPNTGFGS
jgi:hypothetical protein